jgi:hypothetical protein
MADHANEQMSMPSSSQMRLSNVHSLGKSIVNIEALQFLTMPQYSSPLQSLSIHTSGLSFLRLAF